LKKRIQDEQLLIAVNHEYVELGAEVKDGTKLRFSRQWRADNQTFASTINTCFLILILVHLFDDCVSKIADILSSQSASFEMGAPYFADPHYKAVQFNVSNFKGSSQSATDRHFVLLTAATST
jgi:hypothetical protein